MQTYFEITILKKTSKTGSCRIVYAMTRILPADKGKIESRYKITNTRFFFLDGWTHKKYFFLSSFLFFLFLPSSSVFLSISFRWGSALLLSFFKVCNCDCCSSQAHSQVSYCSRIGTKHNANWLSLIMANGTLLFPCALQKTIVLNSILRSDMWKLK